MLHHSRIVLSALRESNPPVGSGRPVPGRSAKGAMIFVISIQLQRFTSQAGGAGKAAHSQAEPGNEVVKYGIPRRVQFSIHDSPLTTHVFSRHSPLTTHHT
jgi:hypothetical protein